MKDNCKTLYDRPSSAPGVDAFFAKFNREGVTADFADRRGTRSKVVLIDFQASGLYAYARNKEFLFYYDQEINDNRIQAIELLGTDQLALVGTYPTKDTPQSDFNKGFLVLKDDCGKELMRTPLANLCKALNGNKTTFVDFPNIKWGSCFVTFNGAATISSANALAFRVYF